MENEANSQRYTESQVLFGLREVWREFTGGGDSFDPDTRIDTYMKSDGSWDEVDFADILLELERFFGFQCSQNEWNDFFGFELAESNLEQWQQSFAPKLTFGALARFIADRAPAIASFAPLSVFAGPCAPAGVFLGIQSLANHVTGNELRFAPSERIIDVLRDQNLEKFWTQLRWMTENAIPELPVFWRGVTGFTGCMGVLASTTVLVLTWNESDPTWLILTIIVAAAAYLLALAYKRIANPLPPDIATFRDLATLIAKHRT